jgi:hypothetical protein
MINSSEEAIREVLAGLQGCDVPLEMEQRILKAVQDQASAESRSGWRWSRPVVTENSVRAGNAKILSACRHSLRRNRSREPLCSDPTAF